MADDYTDRMLARASRRGDLLHDVIAPVSATVLSWTLGIGADREEWFRRSVLAMLLAADPADPRALARGRTALAETRELLRETLATTRKAAPTARGNETIPALLRRAIDEGRISTQDAENTCALLLVAGHETTANMAALGIFALLVHPDQLQDIREERVSIRQAVDELLRFLTIAQLVVRRVAVSDIPLAGDTIRAGEGIYPLISSANRDPRRYAEPDALRLDRDARDHLAFGFGVHRCVGHFLARLELEVIIETVLQKVRTVRLWTDPIRFKSALPTHGLWNLPVTW